jgi:hypothetical protein
VFVAVVLFASSPSQPNSLIVTRCSSRNSTVRDHIVIAWCQRNTRSPHVASFGTAQAISRRYWSAPSQ